MKSPKSPIRLAVVTDFPEERWESMDLVAEMILAEFQSGKWPHVSATVVTPPYQKLFQRMSSSRLTWNLDRLLNRRIILVRGVRRALKQEKYDAVFIVDHSYAHVMNAVKRADLSGIVFCHDLDAFEPLITKKKGWKNTLRRWFARPIEAGIMTADVIVTGSAEIREKLLTTYSRQIQPARVVLNPYGIAPEFQSCQKVDSENLRLLENKNNGPMVAHVGSTIPRKRIDVLLKTVAELKRVYPGLYLVRAGGPLNEEQRLLAGSLGIAEKIIEMPRLSRSELAEVYRRADVVLVTSDAEGFGLPVVEALACGAGVVASYLPVLREPGGDFVEYARVGDHLDFAARAKWVMQRKPAHKSKELSEHLKKFRWSAHVERLVQVLDSLLS